MRDMIFDVRKFLQHHSPELFSIIENRVDWGNLSKRYGERFEYMCEMHEKNGEHRYEASLFEIFMHAAQGRRDAAYIATYVNESVQKLMKLLSGNELRMVADGLSKMIINLDMKYLNFVGEMGVLVIIKTHLDWKLIGVEVKNQVGKGLDFEFELKDSRK